MKEGFSFYLPRYAMNIFHIFHMEDFQSSWIPFQSRIKLSFMSSMPHVYAIL